MQQDQQRQRRQRPEAVRLKTRQCLKAASLCQWQCTRVENTGHWLSQSGFVAQIQTKFTAMLVKETSLRGNAEHGARCPLRLRALQGMLRAKGLALSNVKGAAKTIPYSESCDVFRSCHDGIAKQAEW
jgi:hypothetical protein